MGGGGGGRETEREREREREGRWGEKKRQTKAERAFSNYVVKERRVKS